MDVDGPRTVGEEPGNSTVSSKNQVFGPSCFQVVALRAAVPGEQIPGSEACMSSEVRGGGDVESQGVLASWVEQCQTREQPACWS